MTAFELDDIEIKIIRQLLNQSVVKGEQAHHIVSLLEKFKEPKVGEMTPVENTPAPEQVGAVEAPKA